MKLLGVDIGEHGFGWSVFNTTTETFNESGFCELPALRKIFSEPHHSFKNKKLRGSWNRPKSHFAIKFRAAMGGLENQIDFLCEKYGAIPIFEDECSGVVMKKIFEHLKKKYVFQDSGDDRKNFEDKWGISAKNAVRDSIESTLESQCSDVAERFMKNWEKKFLK